MTTSTPLRLADATDAADLTAFLSRLLRFDRAAAVRLQAVATAEAGGVLAVFGRLPLGSGVLAIRTAQLAGPVDAVDATVSAGQLLESVDETAGTLAVPSPVTGPAWAGLLPPRSGWELVAEPDAAQVFAEVGAAVREFKERGETVTQHHGSRQVLDALADEIWSRPLAAVPALPLRAAHAAYVIGFLRPGARIGVHRAGAWLRLSAPTGSVVLRVSAPGAGLGLSTLK